MKYLFYVSFLLFIVVILNLSCNSTDEDSVEGEKLVNSGSKEYIDCVLDCDYDNECIEECLTEVDVTKYLEGKITYKVKYLNTLDPRIAVMPDSVVMYFKDNITKFVLDGYIFSFSILADNEKKEQTVSAQVMASKYKAKLNAKQVLAENKKEQPEIELVVTENVKNICGYRSIQVQVKPKDDDIDKYSVYYTSEIPLKGTNWNNIYSELPGVLLEYDAFLNDMHIHLRAVRVDYEKVDSEIFKISKKFKTVSLKKIKDLTDFMD